MTAAAVLAGEALAASFLVDLRQRCPQGDELFLVVAGILPPIPSDSEASVRASCRCLQKSLCAEVA